MENQQKRCLECKHIQKSIENQEKAKFATTKTNYFIIRAPKIMVLTTKSLQNQ